MHVQQLHPDARSSRATWAESQGCATLSVLAAAVNDPLEATARK